MKPLKNSYLARSLAIATLVGGLATVNLAQAHPAGSMMGYGAGSTQAQNTPMPPGGWGGHGYGMGAWGGGYGMGPWSGHSGYGMGYGMGPGMMWGHGGGWGMMGGYGYMGVMGMPMGWYLTSPQGAAALGLSQEQVNKINAIVQKHQETMFKQAEQARDHYYDLQRTVDRDQPNMKAVGEAYDKVSADRRAMFLNAVKTQSEVRATLTAEQRKKLDEWGSDGNE